VEEADGCVVEGVDGIDEDADGHAVEDVDKDVGECESMIVSFNVDGEEVERILNADHVLGMCTSFISQIQ